MARNMAAKVKVKGHEPPCEGSEDQSFSECQGKCAAAYRCPLRDRLQGIFCYTAAALGRKMQI